jgi:hypothetical protein
MKTTYYTYRLIGIPVTVINFESTQRTIRERERLKVFNAKKQFETQHKGRPLIEGNLSLIVKFYFPPQFASSDKEGLACPFNPNYIRLIEFINRAARGIVFRTPASFTNVQLYKKYSLEPRTDILLIEERKM